MGWQIWVVSAFVAYSDTPASGSKSAPCSESCLGFLKKSWPKCWKNHEMTSLRVCKSWIPLCSTRKRYLHLFGGSPAIILKHTFSCEWWRVCPHAILEFSQAASWCPTIQRKNHLETYQTEMSSFILQWILIKLKLRGSQDSTKKTLS